MKTWTNPEVEELEVKMTAGGVILTKWENGYLPGMFDPPEEETPENPNPGKEDETTDGQS